MGPPLGEAMPSGGLDMKILMACDSFKGSLDTLTAANCIKTGFQRVFPQAEYALSVSYTHLTLPTILLV